jgi:hypothetical protein
VDSENLALGVPPVKPREACSALVVEDPLVSRLIGGILKRAGYCVTEADTRRGVEQLRDWPDRYNLLITNTPGAFLEFAERVPLIYVAANPDEDLAARFSHCVPLTKPFLPVRLLEVAGHLVDSV